MFAGVVFVALSWIRDDEISPAIVRSIDPATAPPTRQSPPSAPPAALQPEMSGASAPPVVELVELGQEGADPVPLEAIYRVAPPPRAIAALPTTRPRYPGQDGDSPIPLEATSYVAAARSVAVLPVDKARQGDLARDGADPIPLADMSGETAQPQAGVASRAPVSWQTDGVRSDTAIPLQ